MGSTKSGVASPVHRVTLSEFYIMNTEVTNAQFEEFKKITRSPMSREADMPVMGIARPLVLEYISWLSKKDGKIYRLPTEAQWEYAARGGLKGFDYPWGNRLDYKLANFGSDSNRHAMPVKSFAPNLYGLYDMCGNASEMVRERMYDYTSQEVVDPVGDEFEPSVDTPFIIRGAGVGSYNPWIWYRGMEFDDAARPNTGFRLIVERS